MTLTEQYRNNEITPREYVERVWERAVCLGSEGDRFISLNGDMWSVAGNWNSDEEEWQAAAEFTESRLKQIADVKEEIAWLDLFPPQWRLLNGDEIKGALELVGRIRTREQSALAELTKGIRKEALSE